MQSVHANHTELDGGGGLGEVKRNKTNKGVHVCLALSHGKPNCKAQKHFLTDGQYLPLTGKENHTIDPIDCSYTVHKSIFANIIRASVGYFTTNVI